MPTFGEYETIGEPVASQEDAGHQSTVWIAKKSGPQDGRFYAVKVFTPQQDSKPRPGGQLEADLGLEFLEGVKLVKKAQGAQPQWLTPIYGFARTPDGQSAWYATDFYGDAASRLSRSAQSYISRGGRVDGPALRRIVYSIVSGCLSLQRSRGYSHGNLKPGNIFPVGRPRPLRKTNFHLADAAAVAPAQLAGVRPSDRQTVDKLLQQTIEARDLRAVGELILQLVEGRLVANSDDIDYPIPNSGAWERLGKEREAWRTLCNRLIDPQLSIEQVNLDLLERQFRPSIIDNQLPVIIGTVFVAALLAGGGYLGWKSYVKHKEEIARNDSQKYTNALERANTALASNELDRALVAATEAETIRPGDSAAGNIISQVKEAKKKTTAAEAERVYSASMTKGNAALVKSNFLVAISEFQNALKIKEGDPDAAAGLNAAQKGSAYNDAVADARKALESGDFNSAQQAADKARGIRPSGAEVTELDNQIKADRQKAADYAIAQGKLKEANELKKLANALARAKKALEANELSDALAAATEAETIRPGDSAAGNLISQIKEAQNKEAKKKTTAAEAERDYSASMTKGNAALVKSNFPVAISEFQNPDAAAGLNAAQQGSAYNDAVADARKALESGDFNSAQQSADKARRIRPSGAEVTKLNNQIMADRQKDADYVEAMSRGEAALKKFEYTAAISNFINAVALNYKQDNAKAQTQLEKAKDSGCAHFVELGRSALLSGNSAKALEYALEAQKFKATSPEASKLINDINSPPIPPAPITNVIAVNPPTTNPPPAPVGAPFATNMIGIDFLWEPTIAKYVAATELSHQQYTKLCQEAGKNPQQQDEPVRPYQPEKFASQKFAKQFAADLDAFAFSKTKCHLRLPSLADYCTLAEVDINGNKPHILDFDKKKDDKELVEFATPDPADVNSGPTNDYHGLIYLIGNVAEWTSDYENPFGSSYAHIGSSAKITLLRKPSPAETVGVRLILEPEPQQARN